MDLIVSITPMISFFKKPEEINSTEEIKSPEILTVESRQINSTGNKVDRVFFPEDLSIGESINLKNEIRREYSVVVIIQKPQINIYDDCSETQVLFGSRGDSVLLISKDFLEYDPFHQDPKYNVDFHFHNLNLYTGSVISTNSSRFTEAMFLD